MKLVCFSEDEALGRQVSSESERLKWSVVLVRDRANINQAMLQYDPDLLLVDVGGFSDLDWWKGTSVPRQRPVIFINGIMTEEFMTTALESGADAFIPRHWFSPRYFEARIRSLLRFQHLSQAKRFISRLNLAIDNERNSVQVKEQEITLTLTEFKILRELACEEVKVVSREEIQTRIFGEAKLSTRSLDVHICALRKKIKGVGLQIDSLRGVGYRLNPCRR